MVVVSPVRMPFLFLIGGCLPLFAGAAEPVDFDRDVRPILVQRCVKCHGPGQQKSGLRLDTKAEFLRGGDGGMVIKPGDAAESVLIQRVRSTVAEERMPPGDRTLPADEIIKLERWVNEGAVWPDSSAADHDVRRDHWAWQPVKVIAPPAIPDENRGLIVNDIDRFLLAKLRDNGGRYSNRADRRTLIRRLSFDLLGLPPSPEEIENFVRDPDPQAYEKLIDKMLDSPHYGERWARHWLDIAHYADTHGFERDQRRDNAWRYRDWVIRAFNADQPYDAFLRDQIAGDVLHPDDPQSVIATGFLAAGPWDFVGQAETPSPVLKRLARADDLDDLVTQVISSTCAVTINCARCHDHKLDPISQREYYALWAVFAGVKRGDRIVSPAEQAEYTAHRADLEQKLKTVRAEIRKLNGTGWSLADIVGGGDGNGTGVAKSGIDPLTGKPQVAPRGFLDEAKPNVFQKSTVPFVDGVVIPDGGNTGEVPISSTGLIAKGVAKTSGKTWDAIRNGPINSHFSAKHGDVDYAADGHALLSLHANAAITFDLDAMRKHGLGPEVTLRGLVGYFGQTPKSGASWQVLLDGVVQAERQSIGRDDGLVEIEIAITAGQRFLTLLSTDGGNDISHDQICFADTQLVSKTPAPTEADTQQIAKLTADRDRWQAELSQLREPAKVYAITAESPPVVQIHLRGNPEQPGDAVPPGTIGCLTGLAADIGTAEMTDAERRIALARWLTDPAHPLTRRVMVNRLWHHHFSIGLVDTPSDFGLGGNVPSHPELLDWLADQFLQQKWSLKAMHRLICRSAAYRQSSRNAPEQAAIAAKDSGNRWLWRQNPRRLDAESLRDAVLTVSGDLNREMFGSGYRDFDYQEEYAPVYRYRTPDRPELWRRSVYRFVVRTTPHTFLSALDCPNPANSTPVRSVTTTALQSLTLLNNAFMLQQADHFAQRIQRDTEGHPADSVLRAFALAFGRAPTENELSAAEKLVAAHGLTALCRFVLNANEFVYVD